MRSTRVIHDRGRAAHTGTALLRAVVRTRVVDISPGRTASTPTGTTPPDDFERLREEVEPYLMTLTLLP